MGNIRFQYFYRDGSNYKKWAEVVFFDAGDLHIKVVTKRLRDAFLPDGLFIATKFASQRFFLPRKTSLLSMTTASTSSLRSRPLPILQTTATVARSGNLWPRLLEKPDAIGAHSIRKTGCYSGRSEFAVPRCRASK